MKSLFKNIILVVAGFIIGSCQKELPNQSKANQLPSTRLWISSDSVMNETVSRQHLYFYGEDPDGYVTGFLVATGIFNPKLTQLPNPDMLTYSWTTKNDTIIGLPLLNKRDSFTVIVRAVDNNFPANTIPVGAIVKGFPKPYWDKDSNGVFSPGVDIYLDALTKAIDPKGAIQLFPIVNTPPTVQFSIISADPLSYFEQPETTFTVATFVFVGRDDDGNQTLKNYRLALNDTLNQSNWFEMQSSVATRTLKPGEADTVKITLYVKRVDSDNDSTTADVYTGSFGNLIWKGKIKNLKLNSENVLYIKSIDIAGDSSLTQRMPSAPSKKWYVKKPKSRMLVVADYAQNTSKPWIVGYYRDMFSKDKQGYNPNPVSILNGDLKNFDVFSFDRDPNKITNYTYFSNPAFIKTLQLYDVVLWFTDFLPNINAAQIGLFYYTNTLNTERNTYGHVIFTTVYQNNLTYEDLKKFNDFAPLDSTSSQTIYGSNRLPVKDLRDTINTRVIQTISGYPTLYADSITTGGQVLSATGQHTAFFKKLYKRSDSQYIYKLDSSRTTPASYKGQLEIGIIDNQKRFVMFGLSLQLLNGWEHNLPKFFKKVIEGEFGLQ